MTRNHWILKAKDWVIKKGYKDSRVVLVAWEPYSDILSTGRAELSTHVQVREGEDYGLIHGDYFQDIEEALVAFKERVI